MLGWNCFAFLLSLTPINITLAAHGASGTFRIITFVADIT
jgi:hypothetical protein